MTKNKIEFTPDDWVKVRADNEEAARRFFGAPAGWPVKFSHFDQRRPGKIYKVLAVGLVIK